LTALEFIWLRCMCIVTSSMTTVQLAGLNRAV